MEENLVEKALQYCLTAEAAALERTIGDTGDYPEPFWGDVDSRPCIRALHGKGLSLWRLGRRAEATED